MTTRPSLLSLYSISSWSCENTWGVYPGFGLRLWPIGADGRLHIGAVVLAL